MQQILNVKTAPIKFETQNVGCLKNKNTKKSKENSAHRNQETSWLCEIICYTTKLSIYSGGWVKIHFN